MPYIMIDADTTEHYPVDFAACNHDGELDHHWTPVPWTFDAVHEAHCMECGADLVEALEVDWDIDNDGAPYATIVTATWKAPTLA
jgi:hypothetical protein